MGEKAVGPFEMGSSFWSNKRTSHGVVSHGGSPSHHWIPIGLNTKSWSSMTTGLFGGTPMTQETSMLKHRRYKSKDRLWGGVLDITKHKHNSGKPSDTCHYKCYSHGVWKWGSPVPCNCSRSISRCPSPGTKTLKAKHLLRRDPHSWPGFRANRGTRCHWERNLHPPPEPDEPGTARSQAKPLVLTKNSVDQPTFHQGNMQIDILKKNIYR